MMSGGRLRVWWALMAVLVVVAYGPLFGAGPLGEDFSVLVESSRAVVSEPGGGPVDGPAGGRVEQLYDRAGTGGRPLAALSLGATSWLWTADGVWTPLSLFCLRFENLALLLLGAYFLGCFMSRLVVPWTGLEHATAARYSAWMILIVHPLSVSAVASPAARGDILGGLLAAAAGTAFLRGRQERSYGFVALAAVLCFSTALASELGYLLPIWLAAIEYYSSRRYRPGRVRLRTALTTLVVFGAFAGLDAVIRATQDLHAWPRDLERSLAMLKDFGALWFALLHGLEKLGVLIMPVNVTGTAGIGYVLAALVIVLVLRPALHAGRFAPRFWATVLTAWLILVVMTLAMRAFLVVSPGNFSFAAGLFPAILVMATGLSLGATAVTGRRRYGIPLVIALLFCVLARSNAQGLRAAADQASVFSHEIGRVIADGGSRQHYLIVDPPDAVGSHRVTSEELAWMFDHAITGEPLRAEDLWVRPVQAAAILSFAREPEFDELRTSGLTVVLPAERVGSKSNRSWVHQSFAVLPETVSVLSWRNVAPDPDDEESRLGRGHWTGEDGAAPFLADSASIEQVIVDVPGEAVPLDTPAIYWRARGGLVDGGKLSGIWIEGSGGPRAVFDPGTSLAWFLGPRVDSLLLMGALADAPVADVFGAPPPVPGVDEPEVHDEDWVFEPRVEELVQPFRAEEDGETEESEETEEHWVLTLLDLRSYGYAELDCEDDGEGVLVAPDAEEVGRPLWSEPGSLAWALERRIGGVVLERSRGRL